MNKASLIGTLRNFFIKPRNKKNKRDASISRYQTSKPSFKEINRPKTPVHPAKRIERCNFINACFIIVSKITNNKLTTNKLSKGIVIFAH